jgi:hypothetical protein
MLVLASLTKTKCYAYFTCSAGNSSAVSHHLRDMALQTEPGQHEREVILFTIKCSVMQKKKGNDQGNDQPANSDPTARNFQRPNDEEKEQRTPSSQQQNSGDEEEDDDEPVLDEQDLEENDLTDEEADDIEWDPDADEDGEDKDQ